VPRTRKYKTGYAIYVYEPVRSRFFVFACCLRAFEGNRGSDIVVAWTGPTGPFRRTRSAPTAWRMLTSRGSAGGVQILPGFSAFLRACRSHRKVLKPAGNKCKDNEGVAWTAGIRAADKAAVSRGERERPEKQYGERRARDARGA